MKWGDYLVLIILILVSLTLQSTLLATFTPFAVIPDLILILVVCTALIKGSNYGAIFGFCAGLALDLVSSNFIGFHAVTKFIIGAVFGLVEGKIFKENILLPVFVLFVATWLQEFIFGFLAITFRQLDVSFWWMLWKIILPVSIYNAVLAPFIYPRLYQWYQGRSRYARERKRV